MEVVNAVFPRRVALRTPKHGRCPDAVPDAAIHVRYLGSLARTEPEGDETAGAPGGWTAATGFSALYDLRPEPLADLKPWLIDFHLTVGDLAAVPDAQIRQWVAHARTKLVLLALKHARAKEDLLALLPEWMDLLKQTAKAPHVIAALKLMMNYLFQVIPLSTHDVLQLAEAARAGDKVKEAIMTGAERLKAEGRQEGARTLFVDLLSDRYGPLPTHLIERVESATPEAFERLRKAVWTASSLDELFESK